MTNKSRTQNTLIAAHLAKGIPLTSLDALRMFGISRAAARVEELRKQGMDIRTTMIMVIGQHGPARVAQYSLAVKS